jgi:hypothetical protein
LVTDLAGDETIPYTAAGCPTGIDVEFWKMVGAGHTPLLESIFASKVLTFLNNHPKV